MDQEILRLFREKDTIYDYLHNHKLNKDSLVVDIGSYKGNWIRRMNELYGCKCIGVEPISEYFIESQKLVFSDDVKIYNFGLTVGDQEDGFIKIDEDRSSLFCDEIGVAKNRVKLKNTKSFFEMIESKIDVLQINAEGLEYEIIPYMVKNNIMSSIKYIQVQFHSFYPNSSDLMLKCIDSIEKAGFETKFNYPFVWYGAERVK